MVITEDIEAILVLCESRGWGLSDKVGISSRVFLKGMLSCSVSQARFPTFWSKTFISAQRHLKSSDGQHNT